jgi:hypothetical protein
VAGSSELQPQAWVLSQDALHAAQPQSSIPCAALLSNDISSLGSAGENAQMQASQFRMGISHTRGVVVAYAYMLWVAS